MEVAGKSLPILTNVDKGKYGVIVFENMDRYLTMDKWNRELLDKYCSQYKVVQIIKKNWGNFLKYFHSNLFA